MLNIRKMLSLTIAAAVISSGAIVPRLAAATPDSGTNVTFAVTAGTFAAAPVSGADSLKLAGQQFAISVVGNSSMVPAKHGRNWAIFNSLTMKGTVYSQLVPGTAIPIASKAVTLQQTAGATADKFTCTFPVKVLGIALTVTANITLPGGTMVKPLIRPFPSVTLDPTNATVTYANTTAATVLAVQTGTLTATAQ